MYFKRRKKAAEKDKRNILGLLIECNIVREAIIYGVWTGHLGQPLFGGHALCIHKKDPFPRFFQIFLKGDCMAGDGLFTINPASNKK